jgi:hypothetical protein
MYPNPTSPYELCQAVLNISEFINGPSIFCNENYCTITWLLLHLQKNLILGFHAIVTTSKKSSANLHLLLYSARNILLKLILTINFNLTFSRQTNIATSRTPSLLCDIFFYKFKTKQNKVLSHLPGFPRKTFCLGHAGLI